MGSSTSCTFSSSRDKKVGTGRSYRPLAMNPGDRIRVKVVLDGNAAVACVNDDVCLSTRMYDRRENTFGIWSDTVGSEFSKVMLQSNDAAR
ncbi:MAG: hypothetical protein ACOYM3_12810 [Terrimicrobiaceae bacterium]